MSWEWSHTQEAYDNAQVNLCKLDNETIRVIWSEIKTYKQLSLEVPEEEQYKIYALPDEYFDADVYDTFHIESYKYDIDLLLDDIWSFMEEYRTCDNGGFNAYACPYACHKVSFDQEG